MQAVLSVVLVRHISDGGGNFWRQLEAVQENFNGVLRG